MSVSYHVYALKINKEEYKKSRIREFVSKRPALLVFSSSIVLEKIKSINYCKKL